MADWCLVDVMGQDGKLSRVALANADPDREAFAREVQSRYATESDPERGALRAVLPASHSSCARCPRRR